MRRVWAAVLIFTIAIAVCFLGTGYTVFASQTLLEQTEAITQAVYRKDYETALEFAEQAEQEWASRSQIFCGFFSHAQLETADKELAALIVYLQMEEQTHALENCSQLALFCNHLRRVDLPLPENIF